MKHVLFFLLFSINLYSQDGKTINEIYKDLINAGTYYDIDSISGKNGYALTARSYETDKTGELAITYFFNYENKKCDHVDLIYVRSWLNNLIRDYNQSFVKVSELVWKDYKNNFIITLDPKGDKNYFLVSYVKFKPN